MPLRLLDGPAEGSYMAQRAPFYLRAVVDGDKKDVLDQVDDEPTASEKVYVYRREGVVATVHINFGSRNRHKTGFYYDADYRLLPDVDGEALRDMRTWQDWKHGAKEAEPAS